MKLAAKGYVVTPDNNGVYIEPEAPVRLDFSSMESQFQSLSLSTDEVESSIEAFCLDLEKKIFVKAI